MACRLLNEKHVAVSKLSLSVLVQKVDACFSFVVASWRWPDCQADDVAAAAAALLASYISAETNSQLALVDIHAVVRREKSQALGWTFEKKILQSRMPGLLTSVLLACA